MAVARTYTMNSMLPIAYGSRFHFASLHTPIARPPQRRSHSIEEGLGRTLEAFPHGSCLWQPTNALPMTTTTNQLFLRSRHPTPLHPYMNCAVRTGFRAAVDASRGNSERLRAPQVQLGAAVDATGAALGGSRRRTEASRRSKTPPRRSNQDASKTPPRAARAPGKQEMIRASTFSVSVQMC